ncbi:MAG: hypothetical protein ACYTEQ_27875 [Planctomycetota bacterium]
MRAKGRDTDYYRISIESGFYEFEDSVRTGVRGDEAHEYRAIVTAECLVKAGFEEQEVVRVLVQYLEDCESIVFNEGEKKALQEVHDLARDYLNKYASPRNKDAEQTTN